MTEIVLLLCLLADPADCRTIRQPVGDLPMACVLRGRRSPPSGCRLTRSIGSRAGTAAGRRWRCEPTHLPTMAAVLYGIIHPFEDDDVLPPERTVRALHKRGLVELVEPDEDDVLARMLHLVRIVATPAGIAELANWQVVEEAAP